MSIITAKKKPLMLKDFKIALDGYEHPQVVMKLETVNKKKVAVKLPPEIAFMMLEELSYLTLGVTKREKADTETMYR